MADLLTAASLGRRIGERWLWRGLSLSVAEGDRLAVVGPTGAGKSLLLRALCGIDRLDEGELRYRGRAVAPAAMPALRAQVVYLAQRPAFFEGDVESNLQRVFLLKLHRGRRYERGRAERLLEALGRPASFLRQPAGSLSGGEAQLAALLRALLAEPRVLLLDEPTASLDPEATGRAEALLAGWLAEEAGRACVWTSHDPAQLDRVAARRLAV